MTKERIGFLGGGNMGSAIMAGLYREHALFVSETDPKKSQAVRRQYKAATGPVKDNLRKSNIVILAVKPQGFDELLKELKPYVQKRHLIISIAAGISTSYIEKRLPKGTRVIRTMPNLPARVGLAVTGITAGRHARKTDVEKTVRIFQAIGETAVVPERLLDAVTAVSGSGPAYVYYFMEALQEGAQSLGLPKDLSIQLVAGTLLGSLMLLVEEKQMPAQLRKAVTSKGGTTEAALSQLENKKFRAVIKEAMTAAYKRAKQLSR